MKKKPNNTHRIPYIYLGPVYTTVEKSTGHEKRAFLNCDWLKMQLLTGGCVTLGEENNGGELFSWMIK